MRQGGPTVGDRDGESPGGNSNLVVAEGHGTATGGESDGSILVVSWNIQFGVEVEAAAALLAEHDDLAGADIVLVQEMDEQGTDRLADALRFDYVYAAPGVHQQTGRHFGNAVLARWPLGRPEVTRLSHKSSVKGQERVLVRADVAVRDRSIDVGCVHTEVPSLGSAKRLRQFDEIAGAFAHRPEHPMILGGDFNTITRRGVKAIGDRMAAIGAQRVSAGSGSTLRRSGQEFALDHIFARGFELVVSGVVRGSSASDHRALWAVLRPAENGQSDTTAV